jgi:hypothetical protein
MARSSNSRPNANSSAAGYETGRGKKRLAHPSWAFAYGPLISIYRMAKWRAGLRRRDKKFGKPSGGIITPHFYRTVFTA